MAFQYPVKIQVSVTSFSCNTDQLSARIAAREMLDRFDFQDLMEEKIASWKMPEDLLTRSVNVGFPAARKAQRVFANGGAGTASYDSDESDSARTLTH